MKRNGIVIIAGLVFLFSCKEKKETYTVKQQTINEAVYASGEVEPVGFYEIATPIADRILKTYVAEGDIVKKGQLLAILGTTADANALGTVEQQIAIAVRNAGSNSSQLNALVIKMKAAQEKYTADSLNASRYVRLAATGAVSKKESEQRSLDALSSLAEYQNLQAGYNSHKSDLHTELLASRQQKDQILRAIESKRLISPVDGIVLTKNFKDGELLPSSQVLYTIGNEKNYILKLIVDERDINKIQRGQKAVFETDAYQGKQFEATISTVKPVSQNETRSFEVEAAVNSAGSFYPKSSVEANIVIRSEVKAIVIPVDYLVGKDSVIIRKGEKESTLIKIHRGIQSNNWIEITGGLKSGDVIEKRK